MNTANLLKRPTTDSLNMMDKAYDAIKKAFPIPAKHSADLPFAVRDLSRMLTQERGDMAQSYWAAPRFLAAYMRFFLPWNLYRLSWLLPQLPLALAKKQRIMDFGSGPLTLPLALWCFRPDLRATPLTITCFDVALKPMETGLAVLKNLAGEQLSWRIELCRGTLDKGLQNQREKADLIMAGNMLNELVPGKGSNLEERLADLMNAMRSKLTPSGQILLVEPGNRLGGKLISLARKGALQNNLLPVAPCTHTGACPALQDAETPGQNYSGWCHFIYPAAGVPADLLQLGERARLGKDTLAISCLLLKNNKTTETSIADMENTLPDTLDELDLLYAEIMADDVSAQNSTNISKNTKRYSAKHLANNTRHQEIIPEKPIAARIISDLIRLPDQEEPARYACGVCGLLLVKNAVRLPSGGAVHVFPEYITDQSGQKSYTLDGKSGAILAHRAEHNTGNKQQKTDKISHKTKNIPSRTKNEERNNTDNKSSDHTDKWQHRKTNDTLTTVENATNTKKSRSADKTPRSADKASRSADKASRSADKASRSADKASRSADKTPRSADKASRSADKASRSAKSNSQTRGRATSPKGKAPRS